MPIIHKRIEIKAPVSKVYTYLDDPKNDPQWIANMSEVEDVIGSGKGSHFKWTWNMAGFHLKGETTFVEDIPNQRIVVHSKGGIESTWSFDLQEQENMTVINLDVDYTIPVPVLGKLAEKVLLKRNDRDTESALKNLKEKLET